MTNDENRRLRAQLKRTNDALDKEFNNGIALCAEIERLQAIVSQDAEVMRSLFAEIERLRADRLKALQP